MDEEDTENLHWFLFAWQIEKQFMVFASLPLSLSLRSSIWDAQYNSEYFIKQYSGGKLQALDALSVCG